MSKSSTLWEKSCKIMKKSPNLTNGITIKKVNILQ